MQVLDKWMKKYGMQKKPKYIFGISSGASFAIKFPGAYNLDGVISGGCTWLRCLVAEVLAPGTASCSAAVRHAHALPAQPVCTSRHATLPLAGPYPCH